MTDTIYDVLRESHELQRSLCTKLLRASPEGNSRRDVFRELRIELAAHAAAEERFLYCPMLMDDMGLNSSRHALAEHHKIDECVEDLAKARHDDELWLEKARELTHAVRHHLKEEETKFFQVSGKILTDRQKETLSSQYLNDYHRMKTDLSSS